MIVIILHLPISCLLFSNHVKHYVVEIPLIQLCKSKEVETNGNGNFFTQATCTHYVPVCSDVVMGNRSCRYYSASE